MQTHEKIIGIDLGTTNSCVSVVENDRPRIIPNRYGERLTPSVVRVLNSGKFEVGSRAVNNSIFDSVNTVHGIKRLIGRRYNEIIDLGHAQPYKVVPDDYGFAAVHAQGQILQPELISAAILRSLKQSAENYLNEKVSKAVISVPAYFNESQRHATEEAGRLAGFKVARILEEPTAAALGYGLGLRHDRTVAVFDLGGGTFDVTILEMGDEVAEVLAVDGDGFLGGDDFDAQLTDWVISEILRLSGFDIGDDPIAAQHVLDVTRHGKCALSSQELVTLHIPDRSSKTISIEISRQDLEEICEGLFAPLRTPCERALESCGDYHRKRISEIILVGGATRMTGVRATVKKIFGREPLHRVNPDEAVALGAAVQGGIIAGDVRDLVLLDVIPFPIGVETIDGSVTRLVDGGTTVPTTKSADIPLSRNGQRTLEANIVAGNVRTASLGHSLGRLKLDVPPETPEVEVTVDIDVNRKIEVSIRDRLSANIVSETFAAWPNRSDLRLPEIQD